MPVKMLRRHVTPGRSLFGALVLAAVAVTVWAAVGPRFPLDLALARPGRSIFLRPWNQ